MMLNIDVEEMRKGFWRNAPVAAVVFDDEVLAPGSIPREVHDVRVDAIITPTRVIGIARS